MRERKAAQRIYSKLLWLYPREFRHRFGAQMEQNFNDLSREREVRYEFKWLRVAWLFGDALVHAVCENLAEIKRGGFMKILNPAPRTAIYTAIVMALPMAIVFPVATLNIEPLNGYFSAQMNNTDGSGHVIGLLAILTAMFALPFGGVVALIPVVGASRSGAGVMAHRSNLILGTVFLLAGIGLWSMLFLNGLSCAIGVGVCD